MSQCCPAVSQDSPLSPVPRPRRPAPSPRAAHPSTLGPSCQGSPAPLPLPGLAPSPPLGSASQKHLSPSCKPEHPPCTSESRRKVVFSSDLCLRDTGLSSPGISGESQLLPQGEMVLDIAQRTVVSVSSHLKGCWASEGGRAPTAGRARPFLTGMKKNILVLRKTRQVHQGHCTHWSFHPPDCSDSSSLPISNSRYVLMLRIWSVSFLHSFSSGRPQTSYFSTPFYTGNKCVFLACLQSSGQTLPLGNH